MGQGRPWPLSTERIVKYIANSAAKNMSSLDNQMMVPTLTRFGRLAGVRGTGSVTDAVATMVIITTPRRGCAADPPTLPLRNEKSPLAPCGNPLGRRQRRGTGGTGGAHPAEISRMLAMKVVVYSHDADTRAEMK